MNSKFTYSVVVLIHGDASNGVFPHFLVILQLKKRQQIKEKGKISVGKSVLFPAAATPNVYRIG